GFPRPGAGGGPGAYPGGVRTHAGTRGGVRCGGGCYWGCGALLAAARALIVMLTGQQRIDTIRACGTGPRPHMCPHMAAFCRWLGVPDRPFLRSTLRAAPEVPLWA